MDKAKAIELLKQALSEISHLRILRYDDEKFPLWRSKIKVILEDTFGSNSREYQVFTQSGTRAHIRGPLMPDSIHQDDYLENLKSLEISLKSIIQKYEILGVEVKPSTIVELAPKAFIAHEGETEQLQKLKDFLDALGVEYLVAEAKASNGRSIEKQVDWTQGEADFAICLATKGKAINKRTGKYYMGLNVADELGRARRVFGNKIILLMQKGIEPHTNIREIVHESFTTQNMDKAFIKVVKELRNWGFITVGKFKE